MLRISSLVILLSLTFSSALDFSVASKKKDLDQLSGLSGNQVILTDVENHLIGTISVGNPLQDVNVLFDTNSGVLWVPNSECECAKECSIKDICYDICGAHCCANQKDEPVPDPENPDVPNPENPKDFEEEKQGYCTTKNAFTTKDSVSYKDGKKTIQQPLEGKQIKVDLGYDKFRFGPHHAQGLNHEHLQFGSVKDFPASYENLPYDGVFGLARTGPNGIRSPMRQLLDSSMATPTVTLYLKKNLISGQTSGLLNVGSVDNDRCNFQTGHFVPLLNRNDWSFRLFNVVLNRTSMNNLQWVATIDTTSQYFHIPKELYEDMIKRVGGVYDKATDTLTGYCVNAQNYFRGSSINVGNNNVIIDADLIVTQVGEKCLINVRPSAEKGPHWILGAPFLYNKCTYLDYSGRIAFANLKKL